MHEQIQDYECPDLFITSTSKLKYYKYLLHKETEFVCKSIKTKLINPKKLFEDVILVTCSAACSTPLRNRSGAFHVDILI